MHEGLCSKSDFTRLLAIALLNWADDEGYFMANPVLIRGQVFPFLEDSKTIPRSLADLSSVGWIELGKDDEGREVGRIINFAKHQRVDKPKHSTIKDKATFQEQSKTHPRTIQDASEEDGKGLEGDGNGMDHGGQAPASQKPTTSPNKPADQSEAVAYFTANGSTAEQGQTFFDHFTANGWKQGGKAAIKDWRAAARNWIRRSPQPQPSLFSAPPPSAPKIRIPDNLRPEYSR